MTEGGLVEGLARALIYVGMARGGVDERGFAAIRRMRQLRAGPSKMTLAEFKALIREQHSILLIDEETAVAAIPDLLPVAPKERQAAFGVLLDILESPGEVTGVAATRLGHLAEIIGVEWSSGQPARKSPRSKAKPEAPAKKRAVVNGK